MLLDTTLYQMGYRDPEPQGCALSMQPSSLRGTNVRPICAQFCSCSLDLLPHFERAPAFFHNRSLASPHDLQEILVRFCGVLESGRLAYWMRILLNADASPPSPDRALHCYESACLEMVRVQFDIRYGEDSAPPVGLIGPPRAKRRRTHCPKSTRDWLSEFRT